MKVFVAGAAGQIGRHLVKLLHSSEQHSARALVRKQEQADEFAKEGVETAIADLEGSVEQLVEAAKGCDAIVFTAGSGGHTGYDKTLLIDLDAAAKMVEAAEKVNIDRFVIVSAIQAHRRENWNKDMLPYYAAKHYADRMVEQSSLNYTIIRPGGLTNEPGTGSIYAAENLDRGFIPREDVARTIFEILEAQNTYRRSFDLVGGDLTIKDALKTL